MTESAAAQESTKLLPCPFCGSKPSLTYSETGYTSWARVTCKCGVNGRAVEFRTFYNCECPEREAFSREAIAAWNQRTPAASPVAGVSAETDTTEWERAANLYSDKVVKQMEAGFSCAEAEYAVSVRLQIELLKLARSSAEGDGWIAVSERLPEWGVEVCVYTLYGGGDYRKAQCMMDEYDQTVWWSTADDQNISGVTHWRVTLPAPVAKEGRES